MCGGVLNIYARIRTMGIFQEAIMADDLNNRGAQDRSRISLSEHHEVRYWTEALGVSADELKRLVGEVGNSADAVRAKMLQKS